MWIALTILLIAYSQVEAVSGTKCDYAKSESKLIIIRVAGTPFFNIFGRESTLSVTSGDSFEIGTVYRAGTGFHK